jgi:hypothetical protein
MKERRRISLQPLLYRFHPYFYFRTRAIKIITPTHEISHPRAIKRIKSRVLYSINQFFSFSQLIS